MSNQEQQFVFDHPHGSIHQLQEWGDIQTNLHGRSKSWILTEKEDENITSLALIIKQDLPFGLSWLYCPRGPLNTTADTHIFQQISDLAKRENAVFFRFETPESVEDKPYTADQLKTLNANPSHAHYQPESTLIIDLTQSEDDILAQMKPKGRYNIKVAQKHEITVRKSTPEEFYQLFKETTTRDKFSGHPLSYYQKFVKTLGPEKCAVFTAYYKDMPLAAAIVTYFKDTATYYYGASSNQHRNTMAPYLLHWHIMQQAKTDGYQYYDMFGIAPQPTSNVARHPWAGVTSFKLKFGGTRLNYFPAQEIIYKPVWYKIIKLVKWIKSKV